MMTGLVASEWAHGQDRSTATRRQNDQQLQTHFIYHYVRIINIVLVASNNLYVHRQQVPPTVLP